MTEAGDALGWEPGIAELLEGARRELGFGQLERARELCDRALEALAPESDLRGLALYLRGLAREDAGRVEDLRAAAAALDRHPDPALAGRARLALGWALVETEPEAARASYEDALARLAGQALEEAQALLGIARLELASGAGRRAIARAQGALARLSGVLSLEARRQEVLALELLAEASDHPPEAIGFLEDAIARADRIELGRRRALRAKLDVLRARRGPFR